MLVHKATMGVLDRLWTGQYARGPDGTRVPLERPARLTDVDDPEVWWEVPASSPLARKLRLHYPWLRPEVGEDGRLTDVVPIRDDEAGGEPDQEELAQEARARGYQSVGRARRPRGLFGFLEGPGGATRTEDAPSMKKLLKELTQ